MSLAPATRVGTYEVTAAVGSGGMGEVYRARDPKLGRDVALKILPDAFARDPERLARFRHEAHVLASLNHPNIAQIYGIEDSGDIHALVMELVEGPTLADLIARGSEELPARAGGPPPPGSGKPGSDERGRSVRGGSAPRGLNVDGALAIARQIAEALEAAHEQGIIHRDLKPANVKVRDDGTVKVLDFGLAKALDPAGVSGSPNVSQSPTITTPAMTQMGMILGTAAYMSPEQARGRPVDKRTDVWGFGCVLYEMLTGRRAFEGEDVTETLAAIVKTEPDWSLLPAGLAPGVEVFLRRCLRKSVKERVGDIHDVRLALDGAFDTPAPSVTPIGFPIAPRWRRAIPIAATAVVTAAIGGLAVWSLRHAPAPPVVTRWDYLVPPDRPPRSLARPILALSRDGRSLVYNARGGLYLRKMDGFEANAIPGTEDSLTTPFLSPDGLWVGFFQQGELRRLHVAGGAPSKICEATNPFGASWETDGTILFAQPAGILRVPAEGGSPVVVIPAAEGERLHGPSLLPDGDSVLLTTTATASWDDAKVVVHSLSTGTRTVLVERGRDAHYLPSGHLIYAQEDALFTVAFDADRLAVGGAHVSAVRGVARSSSGPTPQASSVYAVSQTGTLAYSLEGVRKRGQLTWFDRSGTSVGTLRDGVGVWAPDLSPDGQSVAVARDSDDGRSTDIWIVDARGGRTRATFMTTDRRATFPLWSQPNGDRIGYSRAGPAGGEGQYSVASTGGGSEKTIAEGPALINMTSWSRDGRFILVDKGPVDIWVIPVDGDAKPFPFIDATPFAERDAQFSPDGRWVAYQSNETTRAEIYVRPFNVPDDPRPRTGQYKVSNDGGAQPRWSHNGKELYWIAPDATLVAAKITLGEDRVARGALETLFSTRIYLGGAEMSLSSQYSVSRDGRFLINVDLDAGSSEQGRIKVVQNWTEELKRLAQAK